MLLWNRNKNISIHFQRTKWALAGHWNFRSSTKKQKRVQASDVKKKHVEGFDTKFSYMRFDHCWYIYRISMTKKFRNSSDFAKQNKPNNRFSVNLSKVFEKIIRFKQKRKQFSLKVLFSFSFLKKKSKIALNANICLPFSVI